MTTETSSLPLCPKCEHALTRLPAKEGDRAMIKERILECPSCHWNEKEGFPLGEMPLCPTCHNSMHRITFHEDRGEAALVEVGHRLDCSWCAPGLAAKAYPKFAEADVPPEFLAEVERTRKEKQGE